MRISLLAGSAIVVFGLLGASAASAAPSANTADLLSGSTVTCGDFSGMSASAQADFVAKMSPPASSLTSNSGQSTTNANASNNPGMTTADPGLTAGQLVAACQAGSPTTSLHDAFSAFSTNNPANTGK